MNSNFSHAVGNVVELVSLGGYKKATKFISDKYTIKATRQGAPDRRDSQTTVLVTMGRPNYAEKRLIRQFKQVHEPFPVKKIIVK